MYKLYNVKLVVSYDLELFWWKFVWVVLRICLCWFMDYVYCLLIIYVIRFIWYVIIFGWLVDIIKRNRFKWMWGDLSCLDLMEIMYYIYIEFLKMEWI